MQYAFLTLMTLSVMTSVAQMTKLPLIPNDPLNVHHYVLPNGFTIMISENHETPRVQTMIAVKAGSKFDPPQTTGLAHYLEHMLFKGSPRYGTLNWAEEQKLLAALSELFEQHRLETDEEKKKAIYRRIDSLSYEASKWAIPNEYDKMTTALGAKGTNAFTAEDMTVYINDIPSNALEPFFKLESERFPNLVLRIFHTELETVYEEFNRSQDNDGRWSFASVMKSLLPHHPYGTQTTIGEGAHLKNPSMVNIHNYHKSYYVPNNMALILSGDVYPDQVMPLVEKYFGTWKAAPVPIFQAQPEVPLTEITETTYSGPQPEHIRIGYRFAGAGSRDALLTEVVSELLNNGQAGLLDINLTQKQKVLSAYSFLHDLKDYTIHFLHAEPKQGQTLEQLRDLLLAEIEKVKKGEFADWLIPAIITNKKLARMKELESNESRASVMMRAFSLGISWKEYLRQYEQLEQITKEEVVAFANAHYGKNYALCYKRLGEPSVHKVQKPPITSIVMNKEVSSPFKQEVESMTLSPVTPRFADFKKDIAVASLKNNVSLSYVPNPINKTFQLSYILDMGTDHHKELGLAISYLPYLGTGRYSPEELKQEFYRLGLSFSVSSSRDRIYVTLAGLDERFAEGVKLLEHVMKDVRPDQKVYDELVVDILQKRENARKRKDVILQSGLLNWAKYGAKNPFNDQLSEEAIRAMAPKKLVDMIKAFSSYRHRILYFGSRPQQEVVSVLNGHHQSSEKPLDYPKPVVYAEQRLDSPKVFFCPYNMKQTELMFISRDVAFNPELMSFMYLFNDYFGSGLSSIVFQEIREKMALAYAAYSRYTLPDYRQDSHYLMAYVGTQSDKLQTAVSEFNRLLQQMPLVPDQFDGVKESLKLMLATDWFTGSDIYWAADRARKRGLDRDIRKDVYEKLQQLSLADLNQFFQQHIQGKNKVYLVMGKKEDLDWRVLESLGPVQELTAEQLFGY